MAKVGLKERQIEIVATAIPKREYYVAFPEGRRLFDMSLGAVALPFAGASSETISNVSKSLAELTAEWLRFWVTERGIADAEKLLAAH